MEFFKLMKKLKFKKALVPILKASGRDYSEIFIEVYKNDSPLLIWAENDPEFIKQSMEELDKKLGCIDFTVRCSDHNHLAFNPVESAGLIKEFLGNE